MTWSVALARRSALNRRAIGAPLIVNNLSSIGVGVADTLMAARLGSLSACRRRHRQWCVDSPVPAGTRHHHGLGANGCAALRRRPRRRNRPRYAPGSVAGAVDFVAGDGRDAPHDAACLLRSASNTPVALLAQGYLDYLSWGVPGAYGYHTLKQMNEGVGRTVPIMTVVTLVLPVNVLLNYMFLFGRFGMPALGAPGCGLGSALEFLDHVGAARSAHGLSSPHYRRFHLWHAARAPGWIVGAETPGGLGSAYRRVAVSAIRIVYRRRNADGQAGQRCGRSASDHAQLLRHRVHGATRVRDGADSTCVGQAVGRRDLVAVRRIGYTGFVLCGLYTVTAALTTLLCAPSHHRASIRADPAVVAIALVLFKLGARPADGRWSAGGGGVCFTRHEGYARGRLLLNASQLLGRSALRSLTG
jgi:MATE family multidrug resistance protein